MRNVEEVSEWINQNANIIVDSIRQESIDQYVEIQSIFNSKYTSIAQSENFRRLYSYYYKLNAAFPTQDFKNNYFDKFDSLKGVDLNENLFKSILNEWYFIPDRKGQHRIEFSFLSKLFHTLDVNQPIYDRFVRILWGLNCNPNWSSIEKIDNYYIQYQQLANTIQAIIDQELVANTMNLLIKKRRHIHEISTAKRIDFLFWQGGNLRDQQKKLGRFL